MKNGNWTPMSKAYIKFLPKSREYTKLEAGFSVQVDYDCNNTVTIAGYSALWMWSRKRVSKFLEDISAEIIYPEDTKKRRNQKGHIGLHKRNINGTYKEHIRCIDSKQLPDEKNIKGAKEEHKKNIKGSTTKEPKTLKPKNNYIYPENYSIDLVNKFEDFIENRKAIKSPMTEKAIKLLLGKVEKLSKNDPEVAIGMLNEAIINNWKSVYEQKNNKQKGNFDFLKDEK